MSSKNRWVVLTAIATLAMPASGQTAAQSPPVAGVESMVQEIRAEMMKPGPVVPGWNAGGADPDAALERAGADRHYLLIEDGEDRHVEIRSARRIADLAPPAWRPIDSYGSPVAYVENPVVAFSALGSGYAVGGRVHRWRENGLDCEKGPSHAILYERPERSKGGPDTETMIGIFRLVMLAVEGQTVCSKADGNAETGWQSRYLLPDGRDLPALNEDPTRVRIVPAAPIADLVKGIDRPADAAPE